MTEHKDQRSDDQRPPANEDLLLDLNFVPEWARKPSGENPYADANYSARYPGPRRGGRDTRRRSSRGPRDDFRPGGDRRRDRSGPGGGRDRRRRREGEGPGGNRGMPGEHRPGGEPGRRADPQRREEADRRPRRPAHERLPIDVGFIPDRNWLGAVVRQMHGTNKAFPLIELASLFIHRPDHYLIKLQALRPGQGKEPITFHQCRKCRTAFLSREELRSHLPAHLEERFEISEVELEPPAGNFVCVCRCRRTGTLLGPPNYHGFQEKMQEVISKHFPGMPLDEYRQSVETVRDPDLVEKWRTQTRTRMEYRPKGEPEAEPMAIEEAQAKFIQAHAEGMVHTAHRIIVPAPVAQTMNEGPLKGMIRDAWQKESRFPLSLSLAMRPAFRHMRLFLFKANRHATFVTPIQPRPVDPSLAVSSVREILEYLHEHPGCTRSELVQGLHPEAATDAPEVSELVRHFQWLIDKGHVIEFYNGTLSVPAGA